jgi:hypothetical protein
MSSVYGTVDFGGKALVNTRAAISSPAQIVADQNNYALPASTDVVRLSSDSTRTITGFVAGIDGAVATICNVGVFDIRIAHESLSSTTANRVTSATGSDVTLAPNDSLSLIYDGTSSRWRTGGVVKIAGSQAVIYDFTRTSAPADASGSNGAYTWSIPSAARYVTFLAHGGGSGGGSGRRGAAGTARCGGGAGHAGGWTELTYRASDLPTLVCSVTVGAGGAGGASVTTDDTNGNAGGSSGGSFVSINGVYVALGWHCTGGTGGTTAATVSGGDNAWASQFQNLVAGSSLTGASNAAGAFGSYATAGNGNGGGGGGADASNNHYAGGNAGTIPIMLGANAGPTGGSAGGGNGSAGVTYFGRWCSGGSGGGGNNAGPGGFGGTGGFPGGGGGGGGGCLNGNASGAGGNGGNGFVRITVWY